MTAVTSIRLECGGRCGAVPPGRRREVEERVARRVGGECRLVSVAMDAPQGAGGAAAPPAIEVRYLRGDYRRLIPLVDDELTGMGLEADRALVSTVLTRMASSVAAGAGAGRAAGGTMAASRFRGSRPGTAAGMLAGAMVGAALGALAGRATERRAPRLVGTKRSGRWTIRKFRRRPA